VSDHRLDELEESARNRGLKLVRSRVRTPGKRRFGKVGLTDAAGKPVLGMDAKGPTATPDEVEDYLRNLDAKDWGASLDVAVLARKRKVQPVRQAANDTEPAPKPAPPKAKPKPPPKPQVRPAKPSDAKTLTALIDYLGHPITEKAVRKNLAALAKLKETPLVAVEGDRVIGLVGIHKTVTVHRDAPLGRITILVVAEEAQGRGIGRMLVEEAEKLLNKAGCKLVEVTSSDRRAEAHAFYRHLGYERTSLRFMKILPGTGRGTTER
jgi:ribosomal protein S18 acetylase RimI-like enzyme